MTLSEPVQRVIARGLVIMVVLIPLSLIEDLIHERWQRKGLVEDTVTNDWGEAVVIGSPSVQERHDDSAESVWIENDDHVIRVPAAAWQVGLDVEERRIGIFEVPVYTARISGALQLTTEAPQTDWTLSVPVTPARAVKDVKVTAGDAKPLDVSYHGDAVRVRFETPVPETLDISLIVTGSESLTIDPSGIPSDIAMTSNWEHPGFSGFRLPDGYSTGPSGFTADWPSHSMALFGDTQGAGVRIVTPVDVYSLVDRSLKYAIFFIALVVGSVFAMDSLTGARVHPVQMGMVAAAMAVFYLLLLACSEIVGFGAAFIIATGVLVAQLGWYARSIYGEKNSGAVAAGILTIVYSAQYGLLVREDYSLLLGSILVSAVVGLLLAVTRRLRWKST